MDIYGEVDLKNAELTNFVLKPESDFPITPKAGRFLFKNKRLMFCVEVENGLPVWIPLSSEVNMYVHSQATASDYWIINHGLGIATVLVQVFDVNNNVIIPDYISCSEDNITYVTFSTPQIGRAAVMAGSLFGTPKPAVAYTQEFNSSMTWTINHGLGYNPEISVFVGGKLVQPLSITHISTTQAEVTFSTAQSGYIRCS